MFNVLHDQFKIILWTIVYLTNATMRVQYQSKKDKKQHSQNKVFELISKFWNPINKNYLVQLMQEFV